MSEDSQILEDWLTFTFSNARRGRVRYYNSEFSTTFSDEWRPCMYCLSCGALWSMYIRGNCCVECDSKKMRMLVCRYRKLTKTIEVPYVWWKPSTWFQRTVEIDAGGVWEYRLKESEARPGLNY